MTLQYNLQYKSILYRINVQYGIILCTIELYNTVQFYVQYSCTLKYVLFGIVHYTVLQYQTIFDYNTKQYVITIPNNTLYCIVFGIVWYWLHYCTLSVLPPLCALPGHGTVTCSSAVLSDLPVPARRRQAAAAAARRAGCH